MFRRFLALFSLLELRIARTPIRYDEHEFNKVKRIYDKSLADSGFDYKLKYEENSNPKSERRRLRNDIWFNPPFNSNVKSNIGKIFLNLIKKHFPTTNKLSIIFNRNTLKISY